MTGPGMTGEGFRYRAFISYSHADHGWWTWLHRGLERYRAPKRLAAEGQRKLGRCFRDEAEMGAAAHLPEKIGAALGASDWLIVVCSPRSAASHWVNKEIADFKALGRGDRVLALVVDGVPGGPRGEDVPVKARECFPEALRVNADGSVAEPLAVDVRKFGRGDALVRLVSEIMGVEYDALREREVRRRTWARMAAGALFATGLALTAGAVTGGYFAAENYAASSAERSALFAREANALFDEGRHAEAMLMALSGDPAAQAGMVERWFNRDGYAPARSALVRAVASNRLEAVSGGGAAEIHSSDISADGTHVATLGADGVLRMWKTGEDAPQLQVNIGGDGWGPVAMHPDGVHVATGSQDGVVRLWKAGANTPVAQYPAAGGVIFSLAFDQDGRRLAVGSQHGLAQIWEFGTVPGAVPIAARFEIDYGSGVSVVTFSPDGTQLALASDQGLVQVRDIATGSLAGEIVGSNVISALVYEPDGTGLLIAARDGRASYWIPGDDIATDTYETGARAVIGAAWRADGQQLSLLCDDGRLQRWRVGDREPYDVVNVGAATRSDLAAVDGGASVLTVGDDNLLRRWRLAGAPAERVFKGGDEEGYASSLAMMPDGKRFVAGYQEGGVIAWGLDRAAPLARLQADTSMVIALAAHPDGERVFVGVPGGGAIWKIGAEAPETFIESEVAMFGQTAFLRDGAKVVSTMQGRETSIWRVDSQALETTLGEQSTADTALMVLPDGERFLTGGPVVKLWREGEAKPLAVFDDGLGATFAIAMLPDGERFLTADSDSRVRLWRMGETKPLARFDTGTSWPRALAVHPDGRHFLSILLDGQMLVWRLDEPRPMAVIEGDGPFAPALVVMPDGGSVLGAERFVTQRRLPAILFADAAGEVQAACAMLKAAGVEDFAEDDWLRFPLLNREKAHPCAGVWGFDPRQRGQALAPPPAMKVAEAVRAAPQR
jgi:WD40 repeat protein